MGFVRLFIQQASNSTLGQGVGLQSSSSAETYGELRVRKCRGGSVRGSGHVREVSPVGEAWRRGRVRGRCVAGPMCEPSVCQEHLPTPLWGLLWFSVFPPQTGISALSKISKGPSLSSFHSQVFFCIVSADFS